MRTNSTLTAGLVALSLLAGAPLAGTAEAARYGEPQARYRVVDVPGSDNLHLRSRPGGFSRVVATVPFDERGLETTGGRRGQWIEIEYRDERGRTVTGWANNRFLALDKRRDEVTYYVTGLPRRDVLHVRARPHENARVKATLRHDATDIHNCGSCENGWCPVEVGTGWRKVSGHVRQDHLAVTRPFTPYLAGDETTRGDEGDATAESGYGYEDRDQYTSVESPRPRWRLWRWLRERENDGTGTF